MKKFSLITFLTTMLAVMATVASVGAASASAANPEFFQKGAPLAKKVKFTSTSGVKNLYSTESIFKTHVECKKDSDAGELTGPRTDTVTIKFLECEEKEPFTGECQNRGSGTKEIETKSLNSLLVWLNKAETLKGLALSPASGTLATFSCPGATVEVTGSVLGEIPTSEYNKEKTEYNLVFECSPAKSTTQKYKTYWEAGVEHPDSLLANGKEACEEEVTPDKIKFAEKVELR